MSCVPPKNSDQKPLSNPESLEQALERCGAYDGLVGLSRRRLVLVARFLAQEPGASKSEVGRRLTIDRRSAAKYVDILAKKIEAGELDLKHYCDDPPVPKKGDQEYDATRSLDMSLQLIVTQKEGLLSDQAQGKKISTQQIMQLVKAEKDLLSIPQRAEDIPRDFYDQLFGRIPIIESEDEEARRYAHEFEELGRAGDLSADEVEKELGIDLKKEITDEDS